VAAGDNDKDGARKGASKSGGKLGGESTGKSGAKPEKIVIKKYANRRLYNTAKSCYVTLDDLSKMVRAGQDFAVYDAKTGDDITRSVLTQIIFEEEAKGHSMLPTNFLRQIISLYGDALQGVVPSYLEASMETFSQNQERMRQSFSSSRRCGCSRRLAPVRSPVMQIDPPGVRPSQKRHPRRRNRRNLRPIWTRISTSCSVSLARCRRSLNV
jgi:polyhydroxyalkanoate synthesis repressor PhaR